MSAAIICFCISLAIFSSIPYCSGEEGTFNNHTDEHRMKFEFVEFERIIREHDMASVEQAERNSIMVMEVITLARKSSNQA